MGKSRLVADLEAEARDLGFAWTWTESVSYGRGEPYRFARVFAQAVADEHGIDSGSFARQLLFDEDTDPATIRRYGGAIAAIARAASFSGWEAEADLVPDDPAETAAILGEVGIAYIERLLDDGRAAGRRPRRRALDRHLERRAPRAHRRDGRGAVARRDRDDAARTGPDVGRPAARRPDRPGRPHGARDRPARDDRRPGRARRRRTRGGSTSGRRATRCSSARRSAPRWRTGRSSCATGG